MQIIVCNAGSTSLKFKVYVYPEKTILATGRVERVGDPNGSIYSFKDHLGNEKYDDHAKAGSYKEGIELFLSDIGGADKADVVAFKAVLAQEYPGVHEIDEGVIASMKKGLSIAPVHNSAYLGAIEAFKTAAPKARLIASFETAFHRTIPEKRYIYGVPYEWYEKYGVRRMGYHGASHSYVAEKLKDYKKVISCHLGGSSSLCAIENGKSVNNSFGLSLQAGVTHVSRAGDIDPFIMPYLLKEGMPYEEIMKGLEKTGGLKGVSGLSGDMRDLRAEAKKGNARAQLAIDIFVEGVRNHIGAYAIQLGGADAISFTAGIGENDWETRKEILSGLSFMGIEMDEEKNRRNEEEISSESSRVKIFVIKADEESVVADNAYRLVTE
ncbi:MAG: acetate/propionate family kinase [Clostridia bacterium]|nr:acetate/propionate family kinase [Clostridia bacterium]MBQ5771051.1 acetate/propionate family kinase [Clostridia bacterium]